MKIELREISVREICDGYKDSEEEGVFAFGISFVLSALISANLFMTTKNATPSSKR